MESADRLINPNILEAVRSVLAPALNGLAEIKLGYIPDKPDNVCVLLESAPPKSQHFFACSSAGAFRPELYNIQMRVRGADSFSLACAAAQALNRYHDSALCIIQTSPVFDIGYDKSNPPRQLYAANFKIFITNAVCSFCSI